MAYRWVGEADTLDRLDEGDDRDLVYVGVVGIIDPPVPEVADAVVEAHRTGVRVMITTGDHPGTAVRIAESLGIVESGADAVTGVEPNSLPEDQLREVTATASVCARVARETSCRPSTRAEVTPADGGARSRLASRRRLTFGQKAAETIG